MDTTILDFIDQAVFVLEAGEDGAPRYAAINQFARNTLGKPLEDIVGLSAKELYPGRLGKIAYDHHCRALQTGQPCVYEILLPMPGRQILVRTTLRPEVDPNGKVIRIVGTSVDISGTQILREMQAEADTMQSEMEDFVNMAAHDLRAPMRNVSHIAAMLRDDFVDMGDGKLDLIDMLEEVAEKAMGLIGDVLAHAQATSLTDQTITFDIQELVSECMTVLDPMFLHKIDVDAGQILGDRTAVQIILRNLLENAIKHSRKATAGNDTMAEGARLAIRIELEQAEDGFFRVRVQDNGTGFDDPSLLFLEKGKMRTDSGFGLLGVRRLIHARRGALIASNCSGKGAEIAFTLPGTWTPTERGSRPQDTTPEMLCETTPGVQLPGTT